MCPESDSELLQIGLEVEINNYVSIYRHEKFCPNYFNVAVFFLVKFSHWSKFHVNIITGSRVLQFSFIRGPEIQKLEIPHLKLGRVRDTKFGTNISNKMLLNAGKC